MLNYTRVEAASSSSSSGARVRVWLDLRANQSTIVALAPAGFFPDVALPRAHVVGSSGIEHFRLSSSSSSDAGADVLVARSTTGAAADAAPGTWVALSDGRNITLAGAGATSLPPERELGPWNLTVQDWLPGSDPWGNYSSVFAYHHVVLEELIPWYNISGLENTSGVGTYATRFTWSLDGGEDDDNSNNSTATRANNTSSPHTTGALLDLGPVLNTVSLWVNGEWTGPIDVWDAVVDIGPYLVHGTNEVRIETSSTLRNRLLQVNVTQSWEEAEYSATYGRQPYGLIAPVRLIPYWEVQIPL